MLVGWNLKKAEPGEFYDDYLSLSQCKNIQGLFAILIMLHHASQKLCDKWSVPEQYIKHGLEPFMYIGYLLVAYYFFSSGYGLYKSVKSKENYLKGFLFKHITPMLVMLAVSSYVFMFVGTNNGMNVGFDSPFTLFGANTNNPYSWYIYVIIICYILFYHAYKRAKTDRTAIIIVTVGIVLLMIFFNNWLYGNWWYNTVLLFPAGLIFAASEEKICRSLIIDYKKKLTILIIADLVCFEVSELVNGFSYGTDMLYGFQIAQFILAILRSLTGLVFILVIIMISMKVRIGNKLLTVVGGFTLEFYLFHGVFVQIFAYEFLKNLNIRILYIKNPFIYVLAIFVLSLITAFLAKVSLDWIMKWMNKSIYARDFGKDMTKIGIGILVIIVLMIIKTVYENVKITNERQAEFDEFAASQDYVTTSGGRMAYYLEGQGEHTIVLLGLNSDPSSELIQRYASKYLASENRVIAFDILGRGFSDDQIYERTASNVASELHEALAALDIDDKYIFMPCEYNGTYVMKYLELYPSEVEAIVGVDMMLPNIYEALVRKSGVSNALYKAAMIKECRHSLRMQKLLTATGFTRWEFKIYESVWSNTTLKNYLPMIEEIFVKRENMETAVEERLLWGDNCESINIEQFPDDLPVLMLVDNASSHAKFDTRVRDLCDSYISNPDIQSTVIMEGNQYFIYYKGGEIAQKVKYFIRDCLQN